MARVWVLDTETKGTGAEMVPLDKAVGEPPRRSRAAGRPRRPRSGTRREPAAGGAPVSRPPVEPKRRGERRSAPLPPGHVRKKATGEIGRVRSVDPKGGTASVLWLRQGRTSTVALTAITRR